VTEHKVRYCRVGGDQIRNPQVRPFGYMCGGVDVWCSNLRREMQSSEVLSTYLKVKNLQKQRKLSLRWALGSVFLFLLLSSMASFFESPQRSPAVVSFGLFAFLSRLLSPITDSSFFLSSNF
jgi:hypothetical protein